MNRFKKDIFRSEQTEEIPEPSPGIFTIYNSSADSTVNSVDTTFTPTSGSFPVAAGGSITGTYLGSFTDILINITESAGDVGGVSLTVEVYGRIGGLYTDTIPGINGNNTLDTGGAANATENDVVVTMNAL